MGWGLVGRAALGGLRLAGTPAGLTATTLGSVAIPVALGTEDRIQEIMSQGEKGRKHKFSNTDKFFNWIGLAKVNEDTVDAAKEAHLNDKYGALAKKYGIEPVKYDKDGNPSYFDGKKDSLKDAEVRMETEGERYAQEKARETAKQIRDDAFNDPAERDRRARLDAATAEEKRRYEEQLKDRDKKYNAALVREAENRLEAAKIRAADRAENREMLAQQGIQASEDRRLTLQLEQMRDKRAFDERRNNAQMAMVAAVTASLGDLGDAFVSI